MRASQHLAAIAVVALGVTLELVGLAVDAVLH